ncbi:MAG: hydantoinase B/oxoprolinase family protein [Pigmentiphaga sp.]|uniref:hydantoinase B/oxoprolinase family protein n=1 Tax=Pigmentiphaga sp. TaxID=1977564 RepID=UPI0029A8FBC6|nr:hydantoinase B/oxoprolinase family protein [Pigmentiphaga sp.]MDX3907599.1 hydantoinase B/oxoprolinase family protein [Pigmentiphaga sp.]
MMQSTVTEPAGLDPAALEILRMQLDGVAERMQDALVRSATSSIAREGMDCAAALFLADGRVIAQARSLPLLLGSLLPAVEGVLKRFPVQSMRAGDAYLLNDPWSGGTHLPDLAVIRPILHDGRVAAFAAAILHHQDVGGSTPGSIPPDATEIFQEGLRIPPIRWRQDGEVCEDVAQLLYANSRTPGNLRGDLDAQWACVSLGEREVAGLIGAYGMQAFASGCDALIAQADRMTRAALATLPDGVYRHTDRLDGCGAEPVCIQVRLEKRGSSIDIDFTGSSPQVAAPVNATYAAMLSALFFFMRTLAPDAPNNHGCLLPARWTLPEGSVVNPRYPAPVNARTATVKLACNAMLAAWAGVDPRHAPAPNSGVALVMSVGGTRSSGTRYFFTEIIAGGAGGSPWGEGASGISTDVGNGKNLPVEMLEAQAPIRVECYRRRRGSGGPGVHGGGDGVVRQYLLLEGEAVVSYRSERHESRPPGAAGGMPGMSSSAVLVRADGSRQELPSKSRFQWKAGERLIIETAGAGGWGDPAGARSAPVDVTRTTTREVV